MNETVKVNWLEALRSGKYKQGQCRLRQKDGSLCCLGVLCDVLDPNGWDDDDQYGYRWGWDVKSAAEVPSAVQKEIGLPGQSTLMEMNDTEGKTFEQIADWIEANY